MQSLRPLGSHRLPTVRPRRALALVAAACLALSACGGTSAASGQDSTAGASTDTAATAQADEATGPLTVQSNTGEVTVTRPVTRVAALDNRTFELLADWGVPVVAAPKTLVPATVTAFDGDGVVDLGTHREPDLEALVAAEPDLIISGQRFTQYNEDIAGLTQGVPLIDLEPREGEPLDSELIRQVTTLGEVFGKQDEAAATVAEFQAALDRAKAAYAALGEDATVMAVNVSGEQIGYVAPHQGRTFGPLFDLLGMSPALQVDGATDSHTGDDISVEAIAESDPAWILVLDRDAALKSAKDATPATQVISGNAALAATQAVSKGRVVYAPADTYTNESIQTYTELLSSMADAFESGSAA